MKFYTRSRTITIDPSKVESVKITERSNFEGLFFEAQVATTAGNYSTCRQVLNDAEDAIRDFRKAGFTVEESYLDDKILTPEEAEYESFHKEITKSRNEAKMVTYVEAYGGKGRKKEPNGKGYLG